MEKKCKKANWMSEQALQKAVKRREVKNKGEKERYTHLNSEFQRTARRDKKAFLSDQCKEIQGNNRIGKTRDLVKKIRDTKGTFHAKMGSVKDPNGVGLREAEDIKNRWQEYTELYKKELHDPNNHDGMITHSDIIILPQIQTNAPILQYETTSTKQLIVLNVCRIQFWIFSRVISKNMFGIKIIKLFDELCNTAKAENYNCICPLLFS